MSPEVGTDSLILEVRLRLEELEGQVLNMRRWPIRT